MTRSRLWQAAVAAFIIINVGGAGFAIAMGEPAHAIGHTALLLVGYAAWLVGPWRRPRTRAQAEPRAQLPDDRIE